MDVFSIHDRRKALHFVLYIENLCLTVFYSYRTLILTQIRDLILSEKLYLHRWQKLELRMELMAEYYGHGSSDLAFFFQVKMSRARAIKEQASMV